MLESSLPPPPRPDSTADHLRELPGTQQFLDADPRPTFIAPIDPSAPLSFGISFVNHAFRRDGLEEQVLRDTRTGKQFRAWAQAVMHWRPQYRFAGRIWTAFAISAKWKCIQATEVTVASQQRSLHPDRSLSTNDAPRKLEDASFYDARLTTLYKMIDMSEVGNFEYNTYGRLLRANESFYRQSGHPREPDLHQDFSFVNLVYPPDVELALFQWNRLIQGHPVTFEMRWKNAQFGIPHDEEVEDYLWILCTCMPLRDNEGSVVSIAGNTIDIGAQKRIQKQALQRAEALERARASERKFTRFALLAPVAIIVIDTKRRITYCNNRFFEMSDHPPTDEFKKMDWHNFVFEEDYHIVDRQWATLISDQELKQAIFRLQRTWADGDGVSRQVWVESSVIPEFEDDGTVASYLCVMTDISRFKWAEQVQKTRTEEALAAKRKHENFIDMTSHEMRNPLSAIIQSADSTIDSLKVVMSMVFQSHSGDDRIVQQTDAEIKQCLDSLHTIVSCSLHQKRVVDDILTLSKMDSNLMAIAPVRVEPTQVISEAVHMFELECKKDGIDLIFIEDPSVRQMRAEYVMMDPSRTLQVLINLLTNAIKFTRDRPTRRIVVRLGASAEPPSSDSSSGISYAATTTESTNLVENSEWGLGRPVYMWVSCLDTGCGMSSAEQGKLFTRFTQATPRTHIRYGGSGLGLFISKKLTELQGGSIGVRSQPDVGSTFTFFVATRIAPPPTPVKSSAAKDAPLKWPGSMESDTRREIGHLSVLIVEDNLVNVSSARTLCRRQPVLHGLWLTTAQQKVLSQQLRKAGCQVHVSNHGAEALEFLRKTSYWAAARAGDSKPASLLPPLDLSVILMDIEMPVMDGLECTRKIRECQESGEIIGHIPIMAVSANARSEQVSMARDAGMDDAISKPFRIPELMIKLETLVSGGGALLPANAASGL
ncbi:hypothetical protein PG993_000333 [Apiospora rasikravindrae]|uniref:Uncharacterized protein n=1 Tax=Apiospora rasikravindrae TaxID=990691 RepID=A0ABR1U886_9PEZI